MTYRSSKSLWLAAAMLAATAAGCAFAGAEGLVVENRCDDDSDCPGARCAPEMGMCVSDSAVAIRLALQITPATNRFGGDTAEPFVIPPFDLTGSLERELLYPTPAQ